jgi:OOP family OmpA-OmpF porin
MAFSSARARITMAMGIEFDDHSAKVLPEYRDDLRKVANFLKANPTVAATVEGHADKSMASAGAAMEISQRRAQKVVGCLVASFAVDRSRLSAEGFGKTRRFAYGTTAEGEQENRRVNVILNYPRKK